jgi:hypothetical protein
MDMDWILISNGRKQFTLKSPTRQHAIRMGGQFGLENRIGNLRALTSDFSKQRREDFWRLTTLSVLSSMMEQASVLIAHIEERTCGTGANCITGYHFPSHHRAPFFSCPHTTHDTAGRILLLRRLIDYSIHRGGDTIVPNNITIIAYLKLLLICMHVS